MSFRDPLLRKKGAVSIRTRWVTVNKGSDDVSSVTCQVGCQEFRGRCGDQNEYFSETPDLALVKALIIVVAVFDVRRAYFYSRTMYNACWEAAQGVERDSPSCSIVGR